MKSVDLIKKVLKNGWYKVAQKGSHIRYKHPSKAGSITIPHPNKDLPVGTYKSILKQAGLSE